jgi:hypothetical protein
VVELAKEFVWPKAGNYNYQTSYDILEKVINFYPRFSGAKIRDKIIWLSSSFLLIKNFPYSTPTNII